jgi:hypothetical protein
VVSGSSGELLVKSLPARSLKHPTCIEAMLCLEGLQGHQTPCVACCGIRAMTVGRLVAIRIKTGRYVEAGKLYVIESLMLTH